MSSSWFECSATSLPKKGAWEEESGILSDTLLNTYGFADTLYGLESISEVKEEGDNFQEVFCCSWKIMKTFQRWKIVLKRECTLAFNTQNN